MQLHNSALTPANCGILAKVWPSLSLHLLPEKGTLFIQGKQCVVRLDIKTDNMFVIQVLLSQLAFGLSNLGRKNKREHDLKEFQRTDKVWFLLLFWEWDIRIWVVQETGFYLAQRISSPKRGVFGNSYLKKPFSFESFPQPTHFLVSKCAEEERVLRKKLTTLDLCLWTQPQPPYLGQQNWALSRSHTFCFWVAPSHSASNCCWKLCLKPYLWWSRRGFVAL